METKEEILNTFSSFTEGVWLAYKEGIQTGYNEAYYSLRNRAAIAAMQGAITVLSNNARIPNEIAKFAVDCADALIEELNKTKKE